jgi:hypothetical protein
MHLQSSEKEGKKGRDIFGKSRKMREGSLMKVLEGQADLDCYAI